MKDYTLFFIAVLFSLSANCQSVYKTPSGEKYHLPTCRMVKNVSQELNLTDALNIGLTPCKICHPPNSTLVNAAYSDKAKGESNTVQCKGKTKKGNRCKHRTSIANGYCFQHNPDN